MRATFGRAFVLGTLFLAAGCGIDDSDAAFAGEADVGEQELRGGGRKRGGTTTPCSTCTLVVTPNPIPLGTESIVISGSGFAPNATVYVATPQDISSHLVVTDAAGSFSWTFVRLWFIPGQAPIEVHNNAGKFGTPLASVVVTVQ